MFYIITKGATILTWHVGEKIPFVPVADIIAIQANKAELDWVSANASVPIPIMVTTQGALVLSSAHWKGTEAQNCYSTMCGLLP